MTLLRERETVETRPTPTVVRTYLEMTFGILGVLVAALGGWMLLADAASEITVFAWTWEVGALAAGWPLGTLIGGGMLMAAGFGVMAYRLYRRDEAFTIRSYIALAGSLLGAAIAVVYALVWIF